MDESLVSRDPEIMSGALCFTGTRVLVKNLFDYLEDGSPLDEFLEDFPSISRQRAIAVLEAAREQLAKMRFLLDEFVPGKLKRALPSHYVRIVVESGWWGLKNGRLLAMAATEFVAVVTVDKDMLYQQNWATLRIAVVILDAVFNKLPYLVPLMPELERVLAGLQPRSLVWVTSTS